MPRPITAIIHTDALLHNLQRCRRAAGDAKVWAVVKANAYGHGIERVFDAFRAADGFALLDLAEAERVRAMGERLGREVFLRQSSLPRASDIDTLFLIRCPTLVIAARDDRLRSLDEALELKEGIPGAQGIIIERSGHMVPLEAPEALAGAIRAWRPT